MTSTIDPLVLGPLMIGLTLLWVGLMAWSAKESSSSGKGASGQPVPVQTSWWAREVFVTESQAHWAARSREG